LRGRSVARATPKASTKEVRQGKLFLARLRKGTRYGMTGDGKPRAGALSDSTRKSVVSALRAFYGHCADYHKLDRDPNFRDPTLRIKVPRPKPKRGLTLSEADVKRYLNAPGRERDRVQETKMTSRTLLIDASEAPTATTTAASRIVRIEIETPTLRRLSSLDVVATGASVCAGFTAGASRGRLPRRCHGPRSCCLRVKGRLRQRRPYVRHRHRSRLARAFRRARCLRRPPHRRLKGVRGAVNPDGRLSLRTPQAHRPDASAGGGSCAACDAGRVGVTLEHSLIRGIFGACSPGWGMRGGGCASRFDWRFSLRL
jgi:hypothetical protein